MDFIVRKQYRQETAGLFSPAQTADPGCRRSPVMAVGDIQPLHTCKSLLHGRNRENAKKAISTAEERGLPTSSVLTHPEGYLIPTGEVDAIETEVTIEEKIRLIYQPACWSVELSSNYTPDDQIFMVTFRLANIGSPFGIDLPGGN